MQIIDPKGLAEALEYITHCESCGVPLRGFRELHHLLARGTGGGSRLDVPFGVAVLCANLMGNLCHTKLHAGNLPRAGVLGAVAIRCREFPETIYQALVFLRWVPSRPIAGEVRGRYVQLTPEAANLVHPYVKELL